MRSHLMLAVLLCLAAGPATQPSTKPALAPLTRERERRVVVDAIKGGDVRLDVVKGDVFTFEASGSWTTGTGQPFGPDGHAVSAGGSGFHMASAMDDQFEGWIRGEKGSGTNVTIGKKARWTAQYSGYLYFKGLDVADKKNDKRSGQIILKYHRVITGKAGK